MAIHHLEHERKRSLYGEVFDLLEPGGVFANFEHVASPTERLHEAFFAAIDEPLENEDPSDRTLDVEPQLGWLRELGFDDVDCYWKWLEMALLIGVKPASTDRLAAERHSTIGRTSIAPPRRSRRDAGGQLDRGLGIVGLEEQVAADRLLGLGKGTVGDERPRRHRPARSWRCPDPGAAGPGSPPGSS